MMTSFEDTYKHDVSVQPGGHRLAQQACILPNWSHFIALHLYAMVHISLKSEFAPLPVPVFVSVGRVGCVCTCLWKQLHLEVPVNRNCSFELSHVILH